MNKIEVLLLFLQTSVSLRFRLNDKRCKARRAKNGADDAK